MKVAECVGVGRRFPFFFSFLFNISISELICAKCRGRLSEVLGKCDDSNDCS